MRMRTGCRKNVTFLSTYLSGRTSFNNRCSALSDWPSVQILRVSRIQMLRVICKQSGYTRSYNVASVHVHKQSVDLRQVFTENIVTADSFFFLIILSPLWLCSFALKAPTMKSKSINNKVSFSQTMYKCSWSTKLPKFRGDYCCHDCTELGNHNLFQSNRLPFILRVRDYMFRSRAAHDEVFVLSTFEESLLALKLRDERL